MAELDSQSSITTKRYGLDISNACYSCKLATIKIVDDKIYIENYCDPEEMIMLQIIKIQNTPYKVLIITSKASFTFLKKDNAPILELIIKGSVKTNLKINKYFTIKSKISSFFIHDCANFEG